MIGGEGITVEIDECMLVRRKHHVGRIVKHQWVFGGVQVPSGKCFLVKVDKRTLIPIIHQYIAPGSTIISDCWKAYNTLDKSAKYHYKHLTVNHSTNFVDPQSGACTNRIESLWQKAK